MAEPKPFASLSSGLLARKGAARPAMRPQGFGQMGAGLEDLGWNDMGFEPPKPTLTPALDGEHDAFGEVVPAHPHNLAGLTPVESPVHKQQAELTGRLSSYSPEDAGEEEEDFDDSAEVYSTTESPEAEADEADAFEPEAFEPEAYEPEPAGDSHGEVEAETGAQAEAQVEANDAEPLDLRMPLSPAAPVRTVQEVLAPAPTPAPRRQRKPRSAPGSKEKAAFTLRLDADRHLKLRLACAIGGRSAQMLVTEALDQLLASMPELDAVAEKAKRKG